jgi:DNA-binding response OmpR family regulator
MKILIVEDEPQIAAFLRRGLIARGYAVEAVAQGRDALERARGADLVVLDLGLPDIDGFEVLRRLRACDDVPVIVLTARGDVDARVEGFRLGADDYLAKPFDFDELVARVRARLRSPARRSSPNGAHAGRLLIVEDQVGIASFLVRELERLGLEVILTEDGDVGAFLATTEHFDLVILDLGVSGTSGLEILRALSGERPKVPVILLTGRDDRGTREAAIAAGVTEYVTKPFVFEDLRLRVCAHLERRAS